MGRSTHYAESKTIKRIRIRSWFQAVSHTSGLSAGELEYQFSLANEQSPRSCIWDKYRRGDVAPRNVLVSAVEDRHPGTEKWLRSPLWRYADETPMEMAAIRSAYEDLPRLFRSIFIDRQATKSSLFWRRPVEPDHVCTILLRIKSIDALIVTLLFVKEAEITQNHEQHIEGVKAALNCLEHFAGHPVLGGAVNRDLQRYLIKSRWSNLAYPEVPEDRYDTQGTDDSSLHPDQSSYC